MSATAIKNFAFFGPHYLLLQNAPAVLLTLCLHEGQLPGMIHSTQTVLSIHVSKQLPLVFQPLRDGLPPRQCRLHAGWELGLEPCGE